MKHLRPLVLAVVVGATLGVTGCAVYRGQETPGAYIDDASITAAIKAKFVEDRTVDAAAVTVETLNRVASLSGFAKSSAEKTRAEVLARSTRGVRDVLNNLAVRP